MEITPTNSSTTSTSTDTASRLPIQTLGQDDFLKLLVTQMTSQDPLDPQKDTEFISQMAQFSALEQAKTMETDMAKLSADQELTQANSLLGKSVNLQASSGLITQGIVSAVQIEAGTPELIVNGAKYDLGQVVTVAPGSAGSTTSTLKK